MRSRRNAGFTLIELMIVIGILLVLMVALIPAIGMFQERSNRFACQANLGHMHRAAVTYSSEEGMNQTMPDGNGTKVMKNFLMYGFIENASQVVCPAAPDKPVKLAGTSGSETGDWDAFFNVKASVGNSWADSNYSYAWSTVVRKNGESKALAADKTIVHGGRANVLFSNGRIEASKASVPGSDELEPNPFQGGASTTKR